MKAVLLSIKSQYCELIANGKKTVEVRRTRPKIDTPFKCYIYCTKPKRFYKISEHMFTSDEYLHLCDGEVSMGDCFDLWGKDYQVLNGEVLGEFICDKVDRIAHCGYCNDDIHIRIVDENLYYKELDYAYFDKCKLSYFDIDEYSNGGDVYGWHISDLIIYDKPKELSAFYRECEKTECDDCPYLHFENTPTSYEGWCTYDEKIPITRPPQSWCYVEEVIE